MLQSFRVGLLLCTLACVTSGSAIAQRVNRMAAKSFDLANYAEAAELYERVLRKDADDREARYRYAYALRVLGRLTEAAEELGRLTAADNPEVAYQRALVLMELGRYPEAVEAVFEAAQLRHPGADALATRLEYAQAHRADESAWTLTKEFANAAGDDFAAETVGEFVVFASARNREPLQLYRSVRDDNDFLRVPTALHVVGPLPGGDAPVAYSPSGELVAFTRNNFTPGERLIPEAGWELSLALAIPTENSDFLPGKAFAHNSSGSSSGFPAFSEDGRRLYFASDRPGGMGGYDIYYSEFDGNSWGAPVNAGAAVNTPGHEIAPHAKSGALYFSSDHLPGFGGMDVYRADLVGGAFSAVTNMGPAINSPLDEVGFAPTPDGTYAYLASNRADGAGGMDLYRAKRSGQAVTIAVVDGKTRAPIANAILDFSDCGQGIFLTGADGAYTFRALPTLQCRPMVRKSGYNAKQFSVDGERLANNPRMELVLNPEDKITIYEGKVIHSRTGDAVPGASVFARHKRKDFTADATTDNRGNYTLSLEREGDYVIEYTASGMARIDREVSTYDRDGAGILSTFAMFPDAKAAPAKPAREMTTGETPGVATVATPYDEPSGARRPAPATTPSEATAPPTPSRPAPVVGTPRVPSPSPRPAVAAPSTRRVAGTVDGGYAIQVAALRGDVQDITSYQARLGALGQVYGKPEGGLLKVRIGPFASRGAAAAALPQVKSLGFSDAWVATEAGGAVRGLDRSVTASRPSSNTTGEGAYLIRLATYSTLDNFDEAKAAALGTLTTRRSGEYTVVLVTGFATAEAAKARLETARAAGFPDAGVVVEADGRLKAVR